MADIFISSLPSSPHKTPKPALACLWRQTDFYHYNRFSTLFQYSSGGIQQEKNLPGDELRFRNHSQNPAVCPSQAFREREIHGPSQAFP